MKRPTIEDGPDAEEAYNDYLTRSKTDPEAGKVLFIVIMVILGFMMLTFAVSLVM